jgi:hypothetical protein
MKLVEITVSQEAETYFEITCKQICDV